MAAPVCLQCERPIEDVDSPFAERRGPTGFICPSCRGARVPIPGARLGRCISETRTTSVFEAVRDSGERCRITVLRSFGPIREVELEREARRASTLRGPNLLRLLGFGFAGDRVWYAEEAPPSGLPLARLLGQKLEASWSVEVAAQLADAFASIEPERASRIAPDAIVMDAARGPFVSVFTAAPFVEREGRNWARPGDGVPGIDLAYSPPEEIEAAASADARTVVYRVGAILHHMLAGERPFRARSNFEFFTKVLHEDPKPIDRADVPASVQAVVTRCLSKKREARFANLEELASALRSSLRGT